MGWIMMPQLPLVAFVHMSGHLIRQRTTKDTQLWGLDRAFEKIACSKNGQDGTRLQAPDIVEGYKGLCPCFTARFPTQRRIAKARKAVGPAELWHQEGKAVPGYLVLQNLHFWAGGKGNPLCSLHGHQSAKAPQTLGDKNS